MGLGASTVSQARADAVLVWNGLMDTLENGNPTTSSRDLAGMNVAIYDAVNAALGSPGKSYVPTGPVVPGASAEAAADGAGSAYLLRRFPTAAAQINATLQSQLSLLPNNAATTNGLALGQASASAVISARASDGSRTPANYVPGSGPGKWQPTPPDNTPFLAANWATVTPFNMNSPSQFRPAGPPALNSASYIASVAQVQSLGAANSATRTLDQTKAAEFWDSDSVGGVAQSWNKIALQVAGTHNDSLFRNAQIFTALATGQFDSFVAGFDSKVAYSFWRPITAITTTTDPNWKPLLAAPPFPSYVALHESVAETGAAILAAMYGSDSADFSLTFDTANSSAGALGNPNFGVLTRSFTSFSEAATESGMSRLWGGIHYDFDIQDGFVLGQLVAADTLGVLLPEPVSTATLLGAGIGGLLAIQRRRRRVAATG